MKKKVLLVIRWPVGGIRTYIRYVYRTLQAEKWQTTIVAPATDEMRVLLEDLAGMNVQYLHTKENPFITSFTLQIFRELMRNSYDLVHSHGFTSGICAAMPARLIRIKHLVTSHDVIRQNQFSGLRGKLKKKLMGALLSLPAIIQSVSYDAQQNLLENFPSLGKHGKCIVIRNGIEVDRFYDASPRDFRTELGLQEDVFLIGFLGRFMPQKGFRYLVDSIDILRKEKSLPKRPLVLTFGDGGFIREEKLAIRERRLENYFCFMPFASNAAGIIKGLDVVAMPSLWEACPLQPMEVLICGTPFIGTDCVGLREVLQGTPATVIPKADASALARALRRIMEFDRKSEFMGFRKTAVQRFDVTKTSESLLKLYKKLADF